MTSSSSKKQTILSFIIVSAGVLLSCITAIFGYDILPDYQDKLFHLRRLAALAETLKSGYFPARIYFVMNQGTGYAMPVFYPDLFLYIPAFLVNVNVPLGIAYDIYVIIINAVTGIVAYFSVKGLLNGEKLVSAVISFVYVLSVYRLTDVYIRDAVGEYTAMAFLPFVIYSYVNIYRDKEEEGLHEKLKKAAMLGLSMALLALTHVLTTMMAAAFLVICTCALIRKTLKKTRIITLVVSVIFFLGLSAYSIVPMIDYMRSDKYLFNDSSSIMRGFYPGWRELLEIIPSGSGSGIDYSLRMPTAVGPAITAILAAWFIRTLILVAKRPAGKDKKHHIDASFITEIFLFTASGVSLFISSKYFPWDKIGQTEGLLRKLFFSVQFSWRYIGISTVCACMLGAFLIHDIYKASNRSGILLAAFIMILAVIPAGVLQVRACSENRHAVINKGEEIGIVSDELYFPVSWQRDVTYDECPATSGCDVLSYARVGGDWLVEIGNTSENAVIVFPIVYYKGYTAEMTAGGELVIMQATDGRAMVIVPDGFSGQMKLSFEEPALWKVAETISLITIIAVSMLLIIKKRSGGEEH